MTKEDEKLYRAVAEHFSLSELVDDYTNKWLMAVELTRKCTKLRGAEAEWEKQSFVESSNKLSALLDEIKLYESIIKERSKRLEKEVKLSDEPNRD